MRARRVAVLTLLVSLVSVSAAQASYPGPNGRIAFVRSGGIYSVKPDGSGVARLTTTAGDSQPVWSPNGRRIAFVRAGDVWTMSANGGNQAQVTSSAATEGSPTWSPDGSWLAFQSDRVGPLAWNVYKLRSSVPYGKVVRLTNFAFGESECPANYGPAWGHNGKIAFFHDQFYCDEFDSHPEAFIMNADGSHKRAFGHCRCYVNQLDWAPGGGSVLAVQYNTMDGAAEPGEYDGSDILSLFLDGRFVNRSSTIPTWFYDEAPAFSPSGTRIAFQSQFSNNQRPAVPRGIWVMNADGSNRTRIVFNGTDPNWGPAPG